MKSKSIIVSLLAALVLMSSFVVVSAQTSNGFLRPLAAGDNAVKTIWAMTVVTPKTINDVDLSSFNVIHWSVVYDDLSTDSGTVDIRRKWVRGDTIYMVVNARDIPSYSGEVITKLNWVIWEDHADIQYKAEGNGFLWRRWGG
jgi:hypothetical protein